MPRFLPLTAAAALLLPAACAHAAPLPPFAPNLPAYLRALNKSHDPAAKALRARIASGPADLARERILTEKDGIPTRAGRLVQAVPPAGQNAAPLYAALDDLRRHSQPYLTTPANSLSLRYTYTPAQLDAVRQTVASRPDILTLLHQAVATPLCVFPDTPGSPFSFPPEYAGMRENARELRAESTLLAFSGKYPEAAANQMLGFRLVAHTAARPKLIGFLVGSALDAAAVSSLQDILAQAGPDADLDSRVSAGLLALPPLSLRHALSGAPADADAEFARLRSAKPADFAALFSEPGTDAAPSAAPSAAGFTPAEQKQIGLLLDAAEADYLAQMRPLIAAADDPQARRVVFAAALARARADGDDPIRLISARLNPLSAVDSFDQQADRVQARRRVAAAGAFMLAAKAKTGAFPSALPSEFSDPFTNKPLGCRLEGAGFVVYSAGPGGTFDGGRPGAAVPSTESAFRYPLVTVPVPAAAL